MNELALYDEPEFLDLLDVGFSPKEIDFYAIEGRNRGGAVLELGCGTGRVAIPLAQAGLDVSGLDLVPNMMSRAAAKAEAAGVTLKLHEGDMRDFDLKGQTFGMIFVALNSFLHHHDVRDITRCLQAARRHLAPGGAFVFDVFNPSLAMLTRKKGERYFVGSGSHPTHGDFTVHETCDYDAATQVSRQTWYWSSPAKPDFFVHPLNLRCIFPQEMPLLVEKGGLRLAARYGDFNRSPFTSTSRQQICVCEAP